MSRGPAIGLVVLAVAAATVAAAPTASGHRPPRLQVVALLPPPLPDARLVSEPHIAVTPGRPSAVVAVAQTNHAVVAWRSADGGSTWSTDASLSGVRGTGGYGSGDPVIALGRRGLAAFAAVAIDPRGRCTLLNVTGSYHSTDGGRTFGGMRPPLRPVPLRGTSSACRRARTAPSRRG